MAGGGSSTAAIDDGDAGTEGSYRIDASSFSRDARELFSFTGVTAIALTTSAGADFIDTATSAAGIDIDSGEGDDELRLAPRAAIANAGDGNDTLTTAALGKLRAHSLGVFGSAALPASIVPGFDFLGKVGVVDVATDFARGLLSATGFESGKFGRIGVGGDFAGHIYATGNIGTVKIGGMSDDSSITADFGASIGSITIRHDVRNADIFAGGIIGSVNVGGALTGSSVIATGRSAPANARASVALPKIGVGGSVQDSFIGAGYDLAGIAVNPDAAIGTVIIRGNFETSDIATGIDPVSTFYGEGDDLVATPLSGPFAGLQRGDPAIVARIARIARVVIAGSVIGVPVPTGEHHAIIAESIGSVRVGGIAVPRVANGGEFPLSLNGDVTVAIAG